MCGHVTAVLAARSSSQSDQLLQRRTFAVPAHHDLPAVLPVEIQSDGLRRNVVGGSLAVDFSNGKHLPKLLQPSLSRNIHLWQVPSRKSGKMPMHGFDADDPASRAGGGLSEPWNDARQRRSTRCSITADRQKYPEPFVPAGLGMVVDRQ